MGFEPNFTRVISSVRKNVGITQSVIELKLPTNENNVVAIYSVGAKSSIVGSEASGKEISFMGLVDFQAVYGGDGVLALDYSAEFRDKFVSDRDVLGELVITSNVVDVVSEVVAGGIRVRAIIEVAIDEIASKDLNILTSVTGNDAHLSTGEVTYSSYIGKAYEKFDVSGDLQLDNVLSVLMVTPCVSMYDIMSKDNYLIVSGKLNLDICYKSGENVQDIETKYHSIDFSWEVAFDGLRSDSIVQSVVGLVYNDIKVSTLMEDGVATININVPVVYNGYVYNENTIEVVEDMYLENNYMSITCENFNTLVGHQSLRFRDNISGVASILDTAPFIDEIVGVCTNNLVLAGCRIDNGLMVLEGIANATVLYYTKETGDITSVQIEMPFVVEEKALGSDASVVAVCLENIMARSKRGKEIEVSAELSVYADTYSDSGLCVITGVNVGEEKPHDDCALYMYIVKPGQTIWDVAKDMNVAQELILEQNPEVELPLKAGDKLVIYRPNLMKY